MFSVRLHTAARRPLHFADGHEVAAVPAVLGDLVVVAVAGGAEGAFDADHAVVNVYVVVEVAVDGVGDGEGGEEGGAAFAEGVDAGLGHVGAVDGAVAQDDGRLLAAVAREVAVEGAVGHLQAPLPVGRDVLRVEAVNQLVRPAVQGEGVGPEVHLNDADESRLGRRCGATTVARLCEADADA